MKKAKEELSSSIEIIERVQAQAGKIILAAQERAKQTIKMEIGKIRDERKRLLAKVAEVDRLLAKLGFGARAEGVTRTGGRASITITDAVLKALESGSQMNIALIAEKASDFKGAPLKPTSVNQALAKLKQEGKVEAPLRGEYKIKK